ncbi:MAG: hypothetical protein Greene041619_160 [Candidatus Peregrinibacteria bacterium Greene0416_19]|nr:MAG: hypothetical protein Greene041619_160 [Candidatus Peregrinibacteria bacterium Greene0416_19]
MVRTVGSCLLVLCAIGTGTAQEKVIAKSFVSPVQGKAWKPDTYLFGRAYSYPTEKKGVLKEWGVHLGEDMTLDPGTPVCAVADGKVAYIGMHPGKSKDVRNWGGVVVLGHWLSDKTAVYTLCGHLELNPKLSRGDQVKQGDELGKVAPKESAANGWWEIPHAHVQINLDPADKFRPKNMPGRGYAGGEAPFRLIDHIALSEVLAAKDPIRLMIAEEKKRR